MKMVKDYKKACYRPENLKRFTIDVLVFLI